MSPSEKADEIIRAEWRKLGFYYDFGEEPGRRKFVGSHSGLLKFRDLLNDYADDPRNAEPLGEHEHYWPYGYLKVETWHKPEIVGPRHARIFGTLKDLRRLARLVEERVNTSGVGEKFLIDKEYSKENEIALEFEVREEGFDPSSIDPYLPSNSAGPGQR